MHTGGPDIVHIESMCNVDGTYGNALGSIVSILWCPDMNLCNDDNLKKSSVLLGPMQAGMVYTCTVTAYNDHGSDLQTLGNITSNTGQSKNELSYCSIMN